MRRAVPQSWGASNTTFNTDKVGDIKISFIEYSASERIRLKLDIVEYCPGLEGPMTSRGRIGLQGEDHTNR